MSVSHSVDAAVLGVQGVAGRIALREQTPRTRGRRSCISFHDWLKANPHVKFHFTPTSASWLNQVEV